MNPPPLVALGVSTVGVIAVTATASRLEHERARAMFARFVPREVVDEVLAEAGDDLTLAGSERDGTALFVDLRAFTAFGDSHGPDEVLRVLNRYLETVSRAVHDHGGTVVSFQGDGVLAVFGAPLVQLDHAARAIGCARALVHERLPEFNRWLERGELTGPFEAGIGLASGTLRSGNVGSADRVEYAAIGDATNTASRLQAMTRDESAGVLIAGSVVERLVEAPADLVELGERDVRGKEHPVRVYTLASGSGASVDTPASTLAG